MKWLTLCAVVLIFACVPSSSTAQTVIEDTGLDLLNKCQPLTRTPMNLSNAEHADAEYCMGFLLELVSKIGSASSQALTLEVVNC